MMNAYIQRQICTTWKGAWTVASSNSIDELFQSDRHAIDARNFADLQVGWYMYGLRWYLLYINRSDSNMYSVSRLVSDSAISAVLLTAGFGHFPSSRWIKQISIVMRGRHTFLPKASFFMPVKLRNTEFQTLTATLLNQLHALINFAKK